MSARTSLRSPRALPGDMTLTGGDWHLTPVEVSLSLEEEDSREVDLLRFFEAVDRLLALREV